VSLRFRAAKAMLSLNFFVGIPIFAQNQLAYSKHISKIEERTAKIVR
jgi:hypothetical protein